MLTETEKEIIVEYPIDLVQNTLISIFPVKYYKLTEYDTLTHYFTVIDLYNRGFIMEITLKENTPNTTLIHFLANYPQAFMDLTKGGKQAIEIVLEDLLNQLDYYPKADSFEVQNNDIEVVNKDNFISTTNNTHTISIITGYILSILSILLPLIALINYDPDNFLMAMMFITGILCLSFEISLSVILQYYENPKPILHGRIQLCLCGLALIMLGIIIHPALAIAGIIIPIIAFRYFIKRQKSTQ